MLPTQSTHCNPPFANLFPSNTDIILINEGLSSGRMTLMHYCYGYFYFKERIKDKTKIKVKALHDFIPTNYYVQCQFWKKGWGNSYLSQYISLDEMYAIEKKFFLYCTAWNKFLYQHSSFMDLLIHWSKVNYHIFWTCGKKQVHLVLAANAYYEFAKNINISEVIANKYAISCNGYIENCFLNTKNELPANFKDSQEKIQKYIDAYNEKFIRKIQNWEILIDRDCERLLTNENRYAE